MKSGTCEYFAGAYLVFCRSDTRGGPRLLRHCRKTVRAGHRGDHCCFQGHGAQRSGATTEQVKPVACFIHSDLAPRDAVRTAGPRLGPTRSAHEDEPGGTAIRPGDGSRGPDQPSRAVQQPTTATGRRTAAAMPRPRDSHRAERPCSHDCTGVPFFCRNQSSAVGRNRGGMRRAVARSKACAIRISVGSLQAGPKKEIPTGSPKL